MTTHGPVVFVHGNPETSAVWGLLLDNLDRDDVFCLSPPGFGAPLPRGFDASMTGYLSWLAARLEAFRQPVDLVGHDWGGVHAVNVAMKRPELLRSWISDAVGVFHADYAWHPLARVWQTPGAGERWVKDMIDAPLEERADALRERGINAPVAERLAAGQDEHMAQAILSLYRSAGQPALSVAGRGISAAAARPGLAVCPANDTST
jgi:pimeloyl-ACP methyl ester carboxylesterase